MALVIAGHQRSGTSMFWDVCNSHPQIVLSYEFGNFWTMGTSYRSYLHFILHTWWKKRNATFTPVVPTLGRRLKGVFMLHNLAFVARYLWQINKQHPAKIEGRTIEAALKNLYPQAQIVGDKYPDYCYQIDKLIKDKSLKCVFMVRDPRSVAYSTQKAFETIGGRQWSEDVLNVQKLAHLWVYTVGLMKKHKGNLFRVRYEDFVQNPAPIVQELGEWLGVDASQFQYDFVHPKSIHKYRGELSKQSVDQIVAIAGETMQQLGYEI